MTRRSRAGRFIRRVRTGDLGGGVVGAEPGGGRAAGAREAAMTDVIPVSAEWLTLRERADARSRSRRLGMAAARMLRPGAVVHDLGSGTGSMMRWLAPLLHGPQTWVLHDWNPLLLEHAAARPPSPEAVVRTSVKDVAELAAADLSGASLVTMSALLDVLTRDELEAIVRACVATGAPCLFTLSVTGRVGLDPVGPGDGVFASAFNSHQRRTVDGRRLLGPDAATSAIDLFERAGWSVRTAASPWRLDESEAALVAEWLDGWLGAAVEARPALEEWAEEYRAVRTAQSTAGTLRVVVDHLDLLAWSP
ncbi:class I SAM-dependent methyltransferase [Microbacterium sp. BWT-B31]|uniref:class I SAM-dependent methyltransferase n=1 Tax=Microbacterium sp. BWT-B31 TaxID=3232072 RepID=UPI0035297350